MRIEKGLKKVPGVKDANVNLATELATVTYNPAQTGLEQMVQKVEAVGYKATPQIAPQQQPVQETATSTMSETLDTQVFNIPQEDEQSKRKQADIIRKQGGFIPGVKPGAATADYIDEVLSRITFPGAIFLTVVAMLPIVISNVLNMPFGFGGTALLIVVGVALDTVQQVQQHLLLRHYDGFMKGGGPGGGGTRVRFRR